MPSFNFVMLGASGRMGQAIISTGKSLEAVCVSELGRNISELPAPETKADVLIDFSLPNSLNDLVSYTKKYQTPIVSGVTGYGEDELNTLKALSVEVPVFWSPNMSLGVAVVRNLMKALSAVSDWDFHVHESHHKNKVDRPSGTAKYIAKAVEEAVGKDVPISDMRGGGVFGVHDTYALGPEEEIQITHRAYSREVFAKGALSVASWLYSQKPGFYTMDDFLG